jgi:hypothetical protein
MENNRHAPGTKGVKHQELQGYRYQELQAQNTRYCRHRDQVLKAQSNRIGTKHCRTASIDTRY